MKHIKLLTIIATCLLLTSIFSVIPVFSAQPPIDLSTYYVGTIGQPARLDPVRAYDTASAELIQNVYQPLIWFGDKHPLDLTSGEDHILTQLEHSKLTYPSGFVPVIATELPIITNTTDTNQIWNFTINTDAEFQKWTSPDNGGVLNDMPKRKVNTDDVVYSFQYQMVYDSPNSPVWMWETPAFNIMTFDAIPGGFVEATVAAMIKEWCHKDVDHPDTNVIFEFDYPFPLSAMAQIFSQTWGSILNKEFYIAHGAWDYSFAAGWSDTYRQMPDGNRTPIDKIYGGVSQYASDTPRVGNDVPDMCGTGPYKYEYGAWDQINKVWRLDYDSTYWGGWGAAGQGDGSNYIKTIIVKGIDTWPTRKMLFLDGEFDTAYVPRANMYDMLVSKYQPLAGLTLVTNISSLINEEVFFTFNVTEDSAYQSFVGYPTHIGAAQPYFFNNTAMRYAFAYALNYSQIIDQGWFGEAVQQASWWVDGLVPQSSKNETLTANMRNEDIAKIKYYLSQAIVDGQNISEVGFETTAIYNTGNDQRQIEVQSIANAFALAGFNYKVNVVGLDWPVFLDQMYSYAMPAYCIGWQVDYADPSDWASPYQQSTGSFLYFQGPPWPGGDAHQAAIDAKIAAAAYEVNATLRDEMYQDLQYQYWLDLPSIPVVQPLGRRFARDWVKGWYYNDLFPGLYFYDLYKSAPGGDVTSIDMDVSSTVAPLTTYPKVFISMGEMKIPAGGGASATMTFNVTVKRNDAAGIVATIISLVRDNLTALTDFRHRVNSSATGYSMIGVPWPNGGWVYLEALSDVDNLAYRLVGAQSPVDPSQIIVASNGGSSVSVTLTWYENGVVSTLPANATWSIGALVGIPSEAGALLIDTNTLNNNVTMDPSTYNCTAVTATEEIPHKSTTYMKYLLLAGDIDGDGVVKILDAIDLSSSFGKSFGQPGYVKAADIDGNGTVNVLDAIDLSSNFGKKAYA
jgi:peptide/nickel transport system substrate-binding protein